MARYRIRFRDEDQEDQTIEAESLEEELTSYTFYNDNGGVIARVPRDAALSVINEEAIPG